VKGLRNGKRTSRLIELANWSSFLWLVFYNKSLNELMKLAGGLVE
jgi:hypothetical protein